MTFDTELSTDVRPTPTKQEVQAIIDLKATITVACMAQDTEDFKFLADNLGLLDSVVTAERRMAYRASPGDPLGRLRAGLL